MRVYDIVNYEPSLNQPAQSGDQRAKSKREQERFSILFRPHAAHLPAITRAAASGLHFLQTSSQNLFFWW
jgi:hypothetical protein